MSESEWTSSEEQPLPKKKTPGWVYGCGAGCLLLVLIGIGLGIFGWNMFEEGRDPEKQWPRLQVVLPYDERPTATHELQFGTSMMGTEQYVLNVTGTNLVGQIQVFADESQSVGLMDPDSFVNKTNRAASGAGDFSPAETIEVQGRASDCLRFTRNDGDVQVLRVELAPAGERDVFLDLQRSGAGPVTAEELERFLAPFDVWRNADPVSAAPEGADDE